MRNNEIKNVKFHLKKHLYKKAKKKNIKIFIVAKKKSDGIWI